MIKATVLAITLVLGSLQIGMTSDPQDGFYALSPDGSGPPIKIFGTVYHVNKRLNVPVLKSEIRSINNANTKFHLTVTMPPGSAPEWPVALYVGGTADPAYGRGWSQTTAAIRFYINGVTRAEQVADFFKIQTVIRRHPQHRLEVSFKPIQDEFEPGQRIAVIFRIRNVGQNSIAFRQGGREGGSRDNQYEFLCRYNSKQVEDVGKSGHLGGLSGIRKLRPGESFEEEVDLSKWFAFDKPGTYNLLGSYYMDFMDTTEDASAFWPIWTDYATADFSVRILRSQRKRH